MILGDLVALRAREPEDAVYAFAWNSDPDVMRWWDRVYPPQPVEQLAERITAVGAPSFDHPSFTVTDRVTGTPIGWCGLVVVNGLHRNAALGVLIGDAAYRGHGYGTDAVRALCRFAFDRMNLVRVSLTVFPGNAGARRTYERLGFVEEGVQRRAFWKRGKWHDLVHMAVFRDTLIPPGS